VGIDHRRANVVVAEQLLYGADVVAILRKMGGKAVPQGMPAAVLMDTGGRYAVIKETDLFFIARRDADNWEAPLAQVSASLDLRMLSKMIDQSIKKCG
jgi:hypothetical protein